MDPKDLLRIVEIMNENDLAEVEIEEEGKRLRLRKREAAYHALPTPLPAPVLPVGAGGAAAPAPAAAAPGTEEGTHTITAPMVGTFYRSPSPDSDPYVEVGKRVGPDSVVCILEAMKVMNEIKAECSGEIIKLCVQNGEAVEYGQALFVVKVS